MLSNYEKISDIGKGKNQNHIQSYLKDKFAPITFFIIFKSWIYFLFLSFLLGSFGRVSKVLRKADGRVLVWKELDYGKMNDKEKQ